MPFGHALNELLERTFGRRLAAIGFETRGPRCWLRTRHPEMRQLVEIRLLKAGRFSPSWGLSLNFVPHVSGTSVRRHRTVKGARMDLRYDAFNHELDARAWGVSTLAPDNVITANCLTVAAKTVTAAEAFFARHATVAGLPDAFEEKMRRPFHTFAFENYVQDPLAYAYVLARVGREQEGRERLSTWIEDRTLRPKVIDRLHSIFEETVAAANE